MLGEIESYRPHTQLFEKLQNMFPTVNISLPYSSNSLFDSVDVHFYSIQLMTKSLPLPNVY